MTNTSKIRVAVLFGGRSPEHEISLLSAANVIEYLDKSRFEVIPVKLDKQGTWFEAMNLPQVDVIFPVMHGTFSEDGTIQGLLELAGVPYVGCGVLASAVGMDKDVARRLALHAGVPVVPYIAIKQGEWHKNKAAFEAKILKAFSFPLFVKPANQGSSIGVSKVKTKENLSSAMEYAFRFDTKILVEQGIPASELEVAVLESLEEGELPFASQVGEIRPNEEFYSYSAKYTDGGAELIIPAAISPDLQQSLQNFAITIFNALNAEGMARIDFFVDKNTQQIYFNEMNSIPGFTMLSMYPRMMTASGVSYAELLTHLVTLAMQKDKQKQKLERNYVAQI